MTSVQPPLKPKTVEELRDEAFMKTYNTVNELRHKWSMTFTDAVLVMIIMTLLNRK